MGSTQVRGGQIKDADITDADIASANKDGTAGTPSMRTLGSGSTQAAAGNHTHAHNTLSGLTSGDDHTQYALLAGRSGGQIIVGGTAANETLRLRSTSNITRGLVIVDDGLVFSTVATDAAWTTDQNDYAMPDGAVNLQVSGTAARNLTGITATGGQGRFLIVTNVGSFDITLVHESVGSSATHRFSFVGSVNCVLAAGASMMLYYDGNASRWRSAVDHFNIALYASLASPTLTGTPAAPTAAHNTNTTQLATTAFVMAQEADDVLLAGRAGGQSIDGGTAANEQLTLTGSAHASKGQVVVASGLAHSAVLTLGSVTGTFNDYNPTGLEYNYVIRFSAMTGNVTLTGLNSTTNNAGRRHLIQNNNTARTVTLNHEDVNSTAANRFMLPYAQSYTIAPRGSAEIWYDATSARWKLCDEAGANYVWKNGIPGGQIITGGTAAGDIIQLVGSSGGAAAGVGGVVFSDMIGISNAVGVLTPLQFTADQNNLDISGYTYARLSSDTVRSVTGLVNLATANSQLVFIENTGTSPILLTNESASSTAANRWNTPSGQDIVLAPNEGMLTIYDVAKSRWLAIEQSSCYGMVNCQPKASILVPANNVMTVGSLPYTIAAGVVVTIAAGAILRIGP